MPHLDQDAGWAGDREMPAQGNAAALALVEPLTPREQEVLVLLATGLANKEIAHRLVLSVNTVQSHLKAIFGKLGVTTRAAATRTAFAYGFTRQAPGSNAPG